MSHDLGNDSNGNWFRSNVGDENQNGVPLHNAYQMPSVNYNRQFSWVQHRRLMCGACGETLQEHYLSQHHAKRHPGVPFIMDMYELVEIDERVQCLLCGAEMFEEDFEEHSQNSHFQSDKEFVMPNMAMQKYAAGDRSNQRSLPSPEPEDDPSKPQVTAIGIYDCKMCDARGIREPNIKRHHSRRHPNISADVDIFNFTHLVTITEKIKCEICGKSYHEKRMEKHRLKYHPDKCEGKAIEESPHQVKSSEGFRQVYMSDSEFELLQSQNRFYEIEGRIYLKDSKPKNAKGLWNGRGPSQIISFRFLTIYYTKHIFKWIKNYFCYDQF